MDIRSASELRELAKELEARCAASRAMPIAGPIVRNAADHLRAIARIHEINERELLASGK